MRFRLQLESYYEDFVKGVAKPEQAQVGDISLQVLAAPSGGLVLTGSNDISAAARADHRDEYHHIEVKLSTPGLTARTPEGYYAQT